MSELKRKASSKKNNITQPTKSLESEKVINQGLTKQADAEWSPHTKLRKIMNKKVASPVLKNILAQANISAIFKEPGDSLQEVVEEDFFNPPLHSTAVDDDEILQSNKHPQKTPTNLMSPIASVAQEKSPKKTKQKPAVSIGPAAQTPDTAKPKQSPKKKAVKVPDPGPSKTHETSRTVPVGEPSSIPHTTSNRNVTPQKKSQIERLSSKKQEAARTIEEPSTSQGVNMNLPKKAQRNVPGPSGTRRSSRTLNIGEPSSTQAPSTTANRNVLSAKKAKSQRKEVSTSNKKKSRKGKMKIAAADTSSPEMVPKSVMRTNELHNVLYECGRFIDLYREQVESNEYKSDIDVFSQSFKAQLSKSISDLQKLNDLKRKNAMIESEIKGKKKCLLKVKHEILVKQPKLIKLQKACSELEQKDKSRKSAIAFLQNLTHLRDDYMKFKSENPHVKETYGSSSVPAFLWEAGNIMKAEQHFHIVNKQLQAVIDKEKGGG
ncbi:centromere protein U isoform 2-T2 [Anomaloglossus baeobatrachus]|uniref:centromere protein U isoform X2 n=1 Tax=Anomaloglossus baeobatrachus TaxID=238106 RepID=UPI003F501997